MAFKNTENMFDEIAGRYDVLNNVISLCLHKFVKRAAIYDLKISSGANVLDLCTGTGDLAHIVKKKSCDANVIGADYSSKMLDIAKKKYKDIKFLKEDAQKLSFKDKNFDYITMGFGFRNIEDKNAAAAEIARVLKPGGKFLHLDVSKSSPFNFVFDLIIFLFTRLLKNKEAYSYLINSKNNFMSPDEIVWFFENFGLCAVLNKKMLFGVISYQIFQKIEKREVEYLGAGII